MKGRANPLWQAWGRTVDQHPERPAFIQAESGQEHSLDQLNREVEHFVRQHPGFKPGRIVAFASRNNVEWLKIFLGCQAVGAAALPLDFHLSGEILTATARDLGAHSLWREGHLHPLDNGRKPPPGTACLKLTSGTSGRPGQIFCRAGHLLADGENIVRTMKIRAADRNLGLIPFGHSYGLGNLILPLILQGSPIISAEEFVVGQIPRWIQHFQATVFPSVPHVLQMLAALPHGRTLSPLRLAISAGANLSAEVARNFYQRYGVKIHNFYGSSETGGIAYDRTGQTTLSGRSVGRALDNVEIEITAQQQILVTSQAVAKGHHRHVVPDLGSLNGRRELCLRGRVQPVANIGGRKVHPSVIEALHRKVKQIQDVWVGIVCRNKRDYLVAVLETPLTQSEVEATIARLLPEWKRPRSVKILAAFPRTDRGKIDRARLQNLL